MRIPEVQDEMRELAGKLGEPRLLVLADELTRRRPVRRKASAKYPALTPEQAQEARTLYMERTDLGYRDIANMLGTAIGRVSEAVRGFRT